MEKRNTLLLTVIAVATLLVAVVGATFAYFASVPQDSAATEATITAEGASSFMAVQGTALELKIPAAAMLTSNTGKEAAVSNEATISADLAASAAIPEGSPAVACKYKVVWVWENAYTRSAELTGDLANEKELTVDVSYQNAVKNSVTGSASNTVRTDIDVKDLPKYTGSDTKLAGKNALVLSDGDVTLESRTTSENPQSHLWTVKAHFYNIDAQQDQAGKTFTAKIMVADVVC